MTALGGDWWTVAVLVQASSGVRETVRRKKVLSIFPLDTYGAILPAFVVGYDLDAGLDHLCLDDLLRILEERRARRRTLETPALIVEVDQQAGGYACRPRSLVGVVLRLESNLDKARASPRALLRALHAMAQDPDEATVERECPALLPLINTCGEPYDDARLGILRREMTNCFDVPSFERGIESIIDCVECDPLEHFANWRALSFSRDALRARWVGDELLAIDEDQRFNAATLDKLATLAHVLELEAPLRTFFLWENSD